MSFIWVSSSVIKELLTNQQELLKLMSTTNDAVQAFAAKVEANFANLKTDIGALQTNITALNAQITALQAQIAGGLSTADAAALQRLVDDSAALDAQAKGVTVPPVTPPPAA